MDLKNDITLKSLEGISKTDLLTLLNNKFHPPRYIKSSQFTNGSKVADEAIDTDNWNYVKPNDKHTVWIPSGQGGILNDDYLIVELLNNSKLVEEAKLPTNGGRRRAQRKTKAKSKKRANKRRTRSRK